MSKNLSIFFPHHVTENSPIFQKTSAPTIEVQNINIRRAATPFQNAIYFELPNLLIEINNRKKYKNEMISNF